jgi:hypothetical protein
MYDALDLKYQMRRFMQGINRTWPHPEHRFYNSAQAATGPERFNSCFFEYTPLDPAPDLVVGGFFIELYVLDYLFCS